MESMKEKVTVCRSWNCTFSSLCVWQFWSFILVTIPFWGSVDLFLSACLCESVRSLQSEINENCANFAFSCHIMDISYNSCVVLPLCPMYVLHRFNVEFTKLVTLQVHWIYCDVRRFFFAVDAVVCSSNSVSLYHLLPISGALSFRISNYKFYYRFDFYICFLFYSLHLYSFVFILAFYLCIHDKRMRVRQRDSQIKTMLEKRERIRDWARMISKCIITVVWVHTYLVDMCTYERE